MVYATIFPLSRVDQTLMLTYVLTKKNCNSFMCFLLFSTHIFSIPAAVVGLEGTSYQVSENVGDVEVCTTVHNALVYCPNCDIPCPVNFFFNVSLSASTSNISIGAGNQHYYILPLKIYEQLTLYICSGLAICCL